jgi:hypothetical protein
VGLVSIDVPKREALPTKPTQHPDADRASGSGQLALTPLGTRKPYHTRVGTLTGPHPKGGMAPDETGAILENHIQERRYIEVVGRSVVIATFLNVI